MTVHRRALLTNIATVSSVVLFGALAANISGGFAVGIMFSGVIGGIALMSISCPKCGHSVMFREHEAFGSKIHAFSAFPPAACQNCVNGSNEYERSAT